MSLAGTLLSVLALLGCLAEERKQHVGVIGAGFSGLAAACELRKEGYDVTLFDKHAEVGGRARTFSADGFTFDYGPSWYWMPGIFDHIFARYGKQVDDYYNLTLLDPAYRVELPSGICRVSAVCYAVYYSVEYGFGTKAHLPANHAPNNTQVTR
jgi:monoamine oxidase